MKYKLVSLVPIIMAMMLLAFPAVNFAQEADPAPIAMLRQATGEMLSALKTNRADIRHNQSALYRVVNEIIIPHVDENSMAQQVVGPEYWATASNADRQLFMQEFVKVVVRTYSAAMVSYSDQQIKFSPLREALDGKNHVEVYSQIVQSNGPAIELNYRLALFGEQWKVRDFSVDGVSLVQNYRSQFSEVLAQKGFAGLLQQLSSRNRQSGI